MSKETVGERRKMWVTDHKKGRGATGASSLDT